MSYEAPELRLVGAAQNLVLGVSEEQSIPGCGAQFKESGVLRYNEAPEW